MFQVGQLVLFANPTYIESLLVDDDWDADDVWWHFEHYEVSAVNDDNSLYAYQDLRYYTEDEDGDEVELEDPEGDGIDIIYTDESALPFTRQMLRDIKNTPQNTLDSICKKVVYLYRKHNNNVNAEFKFSGV